MTTPDTEKRPLRTLLGDCDWVFDHPMLRAIAEKAPTPKAGDDYVVKTLMLPTQVGRALRSAVRLRELYPEAWAELLTTERRPATAVCEFAEDTTDPLGIQLQTTRRFGETVLDTSAHPMLLREFQLPTRGWTSFDGMGRFETTDFDRVGGMWKNFPTKWIKPIYIIFNGDRWKLRPDGEQAFPYDTRVGLHQAVSKTASGIPEFWKSIDIERITPFARPYTVERIRLIVRSDIADIASYSVGHMRYAHMVPYGRGPNEDHRTVTATADFSVGQERTGEWRARLITNDYYPTDLTPGIHLGAERFGVSLGRSYSVDETLAHVAPVFSRLASAKREIDLDTILGQSLFTTPPRDLIDLVT